MAQPWARAFYNSVAWRRCRRAYSLSVFGLCERCGAPGAEVHHKVYLTPANIDYPPITLGWDNLELLCADCHRKEHFLTAAMREGVQFDDDGDIILPPG